LTFAIQHDEFYAKMWNLWRICRGNSLEFLIKPHTNDKSVLKHFGPSRTTNLPSFSWRTRQRRLSSSCNYRLLNASSTLYIYIYIYIYIYLYIIYIYIKFIIHVREKLMSQREINNISLITDIMRMKQDGEILCAGYLYLKDKKN